MIDLNILKSVLRSNQVMVENIKVVQREYDFYDGANFVLIGVRRAGKSFLLFQQMQSLLKQGKTWDDMLYINFEDERLLGFDIHDFDRLLEAHASMSANRPILFMDEVQNIEGWYKFARRMADQKYQVYITGSNAKMLGGEVATTLGGRYVIKEVFPYGFSEYLSSHEIVVDEDVCLLTEKRALILRHLEEYLLYGGFPECAMMPSKREYLMSVYQKIYLGDVAQRHKIENTFALRLLFKKLAESVKQPISYTRLTSLISSTGTKFGKATAINYINYAEEAYLVLPMRNLADNFTERETNMKYYFIDNGVISLLTFDNRTTLLENMVALALWRKFELKEGMVFFYNHTIEVDFVVPEHGVAIQVCYSLGNEADETFKRETQALVKLAKRFAIYDKLYIITYIDSERTINIDGTTINVVPVWKWMLQIYKLQNTVSQRQ